MIITTSLCFFTFHFALFIYIMWNLILNKEYDVKHCMLLIMITSWPSEKLPFDCQWQFFWKKCQVFVIFLTVGNLPEGQICIYKQAIDRETERLKDKEIKTAVTYRLLMTLSVVLPLTNWTRRNIMTLLMIIP